MIKSILAKLRNRKEKYNELYDDDMVRTKLENRKKNANERELDKYYEEERQEQIRKELEMFRKKRQDEYWHGKNILAEKNIFKMKHPEILKQKNIFANQKCMFMGGSYLMK